MPEPRKICVITGTRAEYGQLTRLLRMIEQSPDLELQLLVTGTHLSEKFGMTLREIEADGFNIAAKINMELDSDSPAALARSSGIAMAGFGEAFAKLSPHVITVLGDRFEILAAAFAATLANIPIAHISGGEITQGAFDDAFRHAITKMAHIHFPAAEPYRQRIIQMGEAPDMVFNVGDPAVDVIVNTPLMSREELQDSLGFLLRPEILLVTFHPVTLEGIDCLAQFQNLLDHLARLKDATIIFTRPNADCHGAELSNMLDSFAAAHPDNCAIFTSMGHRRYLSALKHAAAVVGNSSSGIVEAPSLGTPSINIGSRQLGRLRSSSVIDCQPTPESIAAAFNTLHSKEFRQNLPFAVNPYGNGGASERILNILQNIDLRRCRQKIFHDLNPH